MAGIRALLIYLCLLNSVTVWAQTPIGLRASAHLHGILIGTAVIVNHIRQNIDYKQYSEKIQRDSVILVTENELKPTRIWQGEGIYNWNDSDFLLGATLNSTGWAQQNLMQIRGHTLVWPDDRHIPKWLLDQESSITSDKAKSLLSDYIHNVVGRYRGKILWWDVINEAINDSDNTNPLNLRDSFWMRKLGPDFLKFAFQFAKAADPNVKLYYNDYGIESVGLKATRTLNLVNWLRSQGATVHGIGLQWHIDVSRSITRGDGHYQIAQQFINNQLDITVTELDVTIPTSSGYLIDRADLYRQGSIYRAVLEYAIHFYPKCQALLTWGFTDRYSWLPEYHKTSKGAGLPLDWMYLPKPAYWEMQEVMTRVVVDGVYRLSPQLQPDKCLGASTNVNNSDVQLYSGECNNTNQKWNITWLGDGTYRFSLQSSKNRVLGAYDTKASVGQVQTYNWLDDVNQGWAFSAKGNNIFRIVPRTAWWRVMTVNGTSNIGIVDYFTSRSQHWILTKV